MYEYMAEVLSKNEIWQKKVNSFGKKYDEMCPELLENGKCHKYNKNKDLCEYAHNAT